MKIGNHDCHELAEAFPRMDEFRLGTLVDSIETNGLREPIVLFEGKILDGRNRYQACLLAKVEPRFRDFDGDFEAALQYVIDTNLERRDLTVTERVLAEKRLEQLTRLHRRMIKAANSKQVRLGLNDAADVAAVDMVRKQGAPELVAAMESGLIREPAWAAELATRPQEEQRAEVERLKRHEDKPPTRAGVVRPTTAYVLVSACDEIDSVWTDRAKAELAAKELLETGVGYAVREFALNEVDGEVA